MLLTWSGEEGPGGGGELTVGDIALDHLDRVCNLASASGQHLFGVKLGDRESVVSALLHDHGDDLCVGWLRTVKSEFSATSSKIDKRARKIGG